MVLYPPRCARSHADLDLDAIAQGRAEGACELHVVESVFNQVTSGVEVRSGEILGGKREGMKS